MTNYIHPTAIVDPSVKLGNNNYIGPFCYITGDTTIGDNNRFEAYCSVGTPPEHRDYFDNGGSELIIGNNNTFREYCSINLGTTQPTKLGNNITMLRNSHVGHDCTLEDKVNLSCNVVLGGHCYLMEGCNFGLNSSCHQFSIIGAYSMVGMGCVIWKGNKIRPGKTYVGNPAKLIGENNIGLERNNITPQVLESINSTYLSLCQQ
jgi:UDP-N-acetylglucosamine acyltransferase